MKALRDFLKAINYKKQPESSLVEKIRQKQDYIKENRSGNEENTKKKIDEMIELSGHYTAVPGNNRIDLTVNYNDKPVAVFEIVHKLYKNIKIRRLNYGYKRKTIKKNVFVSFISEIYGSFRSLY